MNCPVCGKEMEQGKLLACGSRGLYFLPPDGDADALILTKKYITGQNGIVLDGLALFDGVCLQRNGALRLRLPRVQEDNSGVLLIWKI